MVYLYKKAETYISLDYALFPYFKEVGAGDVLTCYLSRPMAQSALEDVQEKIMTSRYAETDDEIRSAYLAWLEDVIPVLMDADSYLELCEQCGFLANMEGES